MSVPCTALPQSYVPPTPDDLFAKMLPAFRMDPHGKQGQGTLPVTGDELIRRKVIEFLTAEQRELLAQEQKEIVVHRCHSLNSWHEVRRPFHLVPPQTPVLDLVNYQVLLVERYLIVEVISSISYQDRITLLYHYHNQSNLLESARFRSRLFARIKEMCT
jgi:hypothetical protein